MICLRAASRHFSYGEIHSGRAGLGGELTRMIGIVRPSIPLRVRRFPRENNGGLRDLD